MCVFTLSADLGNSQNKFEVTHANMSEMDLQHKVDCIKEKDRLGPLKSVYFFCRVWVLFSEDSLRECRNT